jgi:hypothetical protein
LARTRRSTEPKPAALAGLVAALAVILVGCRLAVPNANDIANSIEFEGHGTTTVATVSPWPLDKSVAFFCLRDPGNAFSVDTPTPPAAAGCTPANVSTNNDRLTIELDPTSLDPATAAAFAGQKQWFIAVAGSRGPVALATRFTVVNPEPST